MNRFTGGANPTRNDAPIIFAHRLAKSEGFKSLFKAGMDLIEDSAAYLDKDGRGESRVLPRAVSLAYSAESMRLTTRIMQLASWLLLQRAVNEDEMSITQALSDKHRVRVTSQELATGPDMFKQLPTGLQSLCLKSLRLQQRILHLDASIAAARVQAPPVPPAMAVASQVARLQAAFGG